MSVFQDIIKGMADGAESLQANFTKLAKAISAIDDDGTIHFGSVSADKLAVNGDMSWQGINFSSGFTPYNDAAYRNGYMVRENVLYIQLSFTTAVANGTIFTLPTGAQPSKNVMMSIVSQSSNAPTNSRIIVYSDGTVKTFSFPTISNNYNAVVSIPLD